MGDLAAYFLCLSPQNHIHLSSKPNNFKHQNSFEIQVWHINYRNSNWWLNLLPAVDQTTARRNPVNQCVC